MKRKLFDDDFAIYLTMFEGEDDDDSNNDDSDNDDDSNDDDSDDGDDDDDSNDDPDVTMKQSELDKLIEKRVARAKKKAANKAKKQNQKNQQKNNKKDDEPAKDQPSDRELELERQVTQMQNEKMVAGDIKPEFVEYVELKVSKNVNDDTLFEEALEDFVKDPKNASFLKEAKPKKKASTGKEQSNDNPKSDKTANEKADELLAKMGYGKKK